MIKNIRFFQVALILFTLASSVSYSQNVGINSTGTSPNTYALLDLNTGNTFTNPNGKGFLMPNVSLANTTDVTIFGGATPPTSLIVYNTNAAMTAGWAGYWYWNGAKWVALLNSTTSGAGWTIVGNAGTTAGTNFLGTTDATDMVFKTNSSENMRIANSTGYVGIGINPPTTMLEVAQNNAIKLGNAALSSGGNYMHLATNTWYNGGAWQFPVANQAGALIQLAGNATNFYTHNGAGTFTFTATMTGANLMGVGTPSPNAELEVQASGLYTNNESTTTNGVQISSGHTTGTDYTLYMGADKTNHASYIQSVQWGTAAASLVLNGRGGNVGIETSTPHGEFDIFNTGANGDGAVFAPDITLDNNFTIQTYIDNNIGGGGWANRVTYAGGCCNNLALQPDVGTVSIGGTSGNYGANKLTVTGGGIGGTYGLLPNYAGWAAYGTGDGGASIYNDNGAYKTLMIVGNNSAGGVRNVSVWDYLTINGSLKVNDGTQGAGKIFVSDAAGQGSWQNPTSILVYGNNAKSIALATKQSSANTASYTPIPTMTITMTTLHNTVYIFASLTTRLDNGGGVTAQFGQALENMAIYVDGSPVAYTSATITDFDNANGIVTSGTCSFAGYPVTIAPGVHTFALYWEPTVLWASNPWTVMCNPAAGAADECILTVFD